MIKICINICIIVFFAGCVTTKSEVTNKYVVNEFVKSSNEIKKMDKYKNEEKSINVNRGTIALIFSSSKIGKYAIDVTNSINSFMLYKGISNKINVYDVDDKEIGVNLISKSLIDNNISKAIALFTNNDFKMINTINDNKTSIYFPLINKNDISKINLTDNLIFGAIDYKKQFDLLVDYSNNNSYVDLYDNTSLGNTLHNYIDKSILVYEKEINDNNGEYENFLRNKKIQNSTIILNTSIIKSSIILSQINGLEININKIISTQLNYTPLILSLTQEDDRKNIIVASSIGYIPIEFVTFSQLTGSDVMYNWVNYASVVGVEYLVSKNLNLFKDLSMQDNQVIYPIRLYEVNRNNLKELTLEGN